jgi:hypothetical protein
MLLSTTTLGKEPLGKGALQTAFLTGLAGFRGVQAENCCKSITRMLFSEISHTFSNPESYLNICY